MMLLNRTLFLLVAALFAGCANGYDCYSCGQVNCDYCPPNPLPYSVSESGSCHDSKGQEYLAGFQTSTFEAEDSEPISHRRELEIEPDSREK